MTQLSYDNCELIRFFIKDFTKEIENMRLDLKLVIKDFFEIIEFTVKHDFIVDICLI